MTYHTAKYEQEKLEGIRRPTGAKNLQRITPLHRLVIAYHLKGMSGNEIAGRVKRTPAWVSTILNDPLVVQELDSLYSEQDLRLRSMMKDSVDQVYKILTGAPKAQDRLKAADMVFKTQGKYKESDGGGSKDSAENIIAAILQRTDVHVHVNGREEPRVIEHQRQDQSALGFDPSE